MSVQAARSPAARDAILVAVAVSAAMAWSLFSGDLARLLTLPKVPYLRAGVATLSDLAMMTGLAALAARRSPAWVLSLTGIAKASPRQILWAVLAFSPVVAAAALLAPLTRDLTAGDIAWPGVLGPFTEELFFRGLAVGVLMRAAGWRFLPAALWPAVFFGAAHLWQGSSPAETAAAVAITGVGGLGFGWLFVRWGHALWPPVLAHAGLNSLWIVFALGDTAVGGFLGNSLRAATILLAIGLTLWLAPRKAPAA